MEKQLTIDYNFGGSLEQHVVGNPEQVMAFFRTMPNGNNYPENFFVYNHAGKAVHVISGFYEALGKYILDNFNHSEILDITGTLKQLNKHQSDIGDITFKVPDKIAIYHLVIDPDSFDNSSWDKQISSEFEKYLGDKDEDIAGICNYIGRHYLHNMGALNWGGHRFLQCGSEENGFTKKYPELNDKIREFWVSEVCEKKIYPIIDEF